jgi:phosphatidylserine/phosphatidylglycerophosphate/cardiolipin synthase-like enzyme
MFTAQQNNKLLKVIILTNVFPDIPFYPEFQVSLIKEIIKSLGSEDAKRIGFFTAWSHKESQPLATPKPHTKPRIIPNYIHSKIGIVDETWATFGSANLDGGSLDNLQLFHPWASGNLHNHEMNYILFNNIPEADNKDTKVVDLLRRRLWSEHLGIGVNDPLIQGDPLRWLEMWKEKAKSKVTFLQNNSDRPSTPNTTNNSSMVENTSRIIEYPQDPTADWRTYLKRQKLAPDAPKSWLKNFELLHKTQAFSFHKKKWL